MCVIFTIKSFLELWAPGKQVTDKVAELFACIGRDLTERELSAAVAQSQQWLRPEDKERWDIPVNRPDDMGRMIKILEELGLALPSMPEQRSFDEAIILGATSYSMEARLDALLESGVDFSGLSILGSERPVNQKEVDHLTDLADFSSSMTEASAGLALLGAYTEILQKRGYPSLQIVCAPTKENGKRATTDDTIELWCRKSVQFDYVRNRSPKYLFVSHQPFGLRQALTVHRCLRGHEFDYDFLFGPLSKRVEDNPALLVDTAARTLWEINQVVEEFYD